MNSQRLSLVVLFVLGLSVESWASVHTAITGIEADTENTISMEFVLPGDTTLIDGEIDSNPDSNPDTDLLKFELSAATTISIVELETSPTLDTNLIEFHPFDQGHAGDEDSAAGNHDLVDRNFEIFAISTTEAHGLSGQEDGHNDIHYVIFYRADTSQALHTMNAGVIPEPTTFAVWSLLGLTFAGAGSRRRL